MLVVSRRVLACSMRVLISYVFPRITGCGLLLTISGVYSTLASRNPALQFPYYQMTVMLAVMIVCIWYMAIIQTAGKKYY